MEDSKINTNKDRSVRIQKSAALKGELSIPGDKSISHRSIMIGALAKGTTEITNFLMGADCLSTVDCFKKMGVPIEISDSHIIIHGQGLYGLKESDTPLDCGNSGTTLRLISGILAAQSFTTDVTGDDSLCSRPMNRIIEPLSRMGARIASIHKDGCAPLSINGTSLSGIHYYTPVASAQVKSAILLAGLYARGETVVTEPSHSRNHTELMLAGFEADISCENTTTVIRPGKELSGQKIHVPGDISSAAYFIAAGLIVPGSEVLIKDVGINPTRDGILKVCEKMGGNITLLNQRTDCQERIADILIKHSPLTGVTIEGDIIPTLIDELPVIAVMACFARGTTTIKDAAELKVKESNRIAIMVENLKAMGADIDETKDGMIIRGGRPLSGSIIESRKDHRIAMSFAVAGLAADDITTIKDGDCVAISYPGFYEDLIRISNYD